MVDSVVILYLKSDRPNVLVGGDGAPCIIYVF